MTISNELRVGIMFFTGLILLVALIVTLTRWGQDHDFRSFSIRFTSAQGILSGADVRLAGVKIGQVSSVVVDPNTTAAIVIVHVDRRIDLYTGYTYTIGLNGLVGERYVDIMPQSPPGARVVAGMLVQGASSGDINSLVNTANTAVGKLATTADALNAVIANPRTQQDLRQAAENLNKTTAESAELANSLNQMLQRNQHSIDALVVDLQNVAGGLRTVSDQLVNSKLLGNLTEASQNTVRLTDKLNTMADSVNVIFTDPQMKHNLQQTVANLQAASVSLEKTLADAQTAAAALPAATANMTKATAGLPQAAADLSKATADLPAITGPIREVTPEISQNMLDISRKLRLTSDAIGGIASSVAKTGATLGSLTLRPEASIIALSNGNPRVRSDLNVDIRTKRDMLRLGMADIGGSSGVNVQFGNELHNNLWFRYGLVQSRFGLGLDYQASSNLDFSGEIFDPSAVRVNALVNYRLAPLGKRWWLTTGVYDLFDGNRLGLGVSYRP